MSKELDELLTNAKNLLKAEVTTISYETWIKNLEIESADNDHIILVATSSFQRDAVDSKYHDLLVNTFQFITKRQNTVSIIVREEKEPLVQEETFAENPEQNARLFQF